MSEPPSPKRQLQRKRRENVAGGRPRSHVVRVSAEEEARLLLMANGEVTIPRLLVETTLAQGGETPTELRSALAELFRMRRQLTGMATNVNQIAHAVNIDGLLPVGSAATIRDIERVVNKIDEAIERVARP